jgi:hypothetical protein
MELDKESQWNGLDDRDAKFALPQSSNIPYLVAVAVMVALSLAAVVGVTLIRPSQDNASIYVLIFASTGPTTLALLAFMKAQETHLSVNSRLEQFIRNAARAQRAEGELAGRAAEQAGADRRMGGGGPER